MVQQARTSIDDAVPAHQETYDVGRKSLFGLPASSVQQALQRVLEPLAPSSKPVYISSLQCYDQWLAEHHLSIKLVKHADMLEWRDYLRQQYSDTSAARIMTVTHRLHQELFRMGITHETPVVALPPPTRAVCAREQEARALSEEQARFLLALPDRETLLGLRNYVILLLCLRTGLRVSEMALLEVRDLQERSVRLHLLVVRKKQRDELIKLPQDVYHILTRYLERLAACQCDDDDGGDDAFSEQQSTPLFVMFRKGDHPSRTRLSVAGIEKMIAEHGVVAFGRPISSRVLRATFLRLALPGSAALLDGGTSKPVGSYARRRSAKSEPRAGMTRLYDRFPANEQQALHLAEQQRSALVDYMFFA